MWFYFSTCGKKKHGPFSRAEKTTQLLIKLRNGNTDRVLESRDVRACKHHSAIGIILIKINVRDYFYLKTYTFT